MKITFGAAFVVAFALLSSPTLAQTRHRRSVKRAPETDESTAALKAGRAQVASEIKNLTRFLYVFGVVAKDIESAKVAPAGDDPAAKHVISENERSKAKIVESVKEVSQGLVKLDSDFRSNQSIKSYYPYLTGIAILGETAETQANAGRFDDTGKTLLKAIDQLADALAAME